MRYVHLIVNTAYTAPYIELINRNFAEHEHRFCVIRGWSESKVKIPSFKNVYAINNHNNIANGFVLLKDMNRAEKIFIHGLFSPFITYLLALQPWLLRKSNWMIWGGDLHLYTARRKTFGARLNESVRRFCIKRFAELTTIIPGDFALAQEWYQARGRHRKAMYSTAMSIPKIDAILHTLPEPLANKPLSIQIGNSASAENYHFEIIDLLKKYREENVRIFALLSYGDEQYAKKVADYGRSIFGDKFIVVKEYMAFEAFVAYMSNIDIVVFNHKRQQALGNLFLALYLKKKVFLNPESTLWELFCQEFCIQLENVVNIQEMDFGHFSQLNEAILTENKKKVTAILDEQYIVAFWKDLFDNNR